MSEKKIGPIQIPGITGPREATEVSIKESTERWTEVVLDDGSILRIKPVVLSAIRMDDLYDQDGNPVYQLKVNQLMTVASAPDHLKKSAEKPNVKH